MFGNALTSIGAVVSVVSVVAVLALAACGGPSTQSGADQDPIVSDSPPESGPEPVPELDLPEFGIEAAQRTTVIQLGNELRVGGIPPPGQGVLASAAAHGDATVRYGRLRDGLGAAFLTEYLSADTSFGDGVLLRFPEAPVVRFDARPRAGGPRRVHEALCRQKGRTPRLGTQPPYDVV